MPQPLKPHYELLLESGVGGGKMIVQNTGVHSRQDRRGEYYYIMEDRILDKLLQRDGLEQATQLFLGRTYR